MKKFFVILPIILVLSSLSLYAQEDRKSVDSEKMESFLKKEKKKTLPIYWSFEFGKSYLSTTNEVKNAKQTFYADGSAAWNFYFDIPLGSKREQQKNWGFSVAPGFGFSMTSFNVDKELIRDVDGKLTFIPFTQDFEQSYFGAMFFDIPIDLRYITKPNSKLVNYSFELGPKFGVNLMGNKGTVFKQNDEVIYTITQGVKNLNSFRYGVVGKFGVRKVTVSKSNGEMFGLSFHLIGSYFPSQVFEKGHGIETNYYFLGMGLGFIFQ